MTLLVYTAPIVRSFAVEAPRFLVEKPIQQRGDQTSPKGKKPKKKKPSSKKPHKISP